MKSEQTCVRGSWNNSGYGFVMTLIKRCLFNCDIRRPFDGMTCSRKDLCAKQPRVSGASRLNFCGSPWPPVLAILALGLAGCDGTSGLNLTGFGSATSANELASNQITLAIEVEKDYFDTSSSERDVSITVDLRTGTSGSVVELANGEQLMLVRQGAHQTLEKWSTFGFFGTSSAYYGATYKEIDGADADMSLIFVRANGSSVTIPLKVSDPAQVSSPTPYLSFHPESDPFLFSWSNGALPVNEVILDGACISGYRASVSDTQLIVPAGNMSSRGSCEGTAIVKQESTTTSPIDSEMPYSYTFRFIRRIPVSPY